MSQCTQRFLSTFAETVDFYGGDDPQYWTLLPLTDAEATDFLQRHDPPNQLELMMVGPSRRCLLRDRSKGAKERTYWRTGNRIGPHD